MQFRYHRGGLQDSMSTLMTGSRAEIEAKLIEDGYNQIAFEVYDDMPDERIGWKCTWLVTGGHRDWKKAARAGQVYPIGFADGDR
jgi:hypothetical protein